MYVCLRVHRFTKNIYHKKSLQIAIADDLKVAMNDSYTAIIFVLASSLSLISSSESGVVGAVGRES